MRNLRFVAVALAFVLALSCRARGLAQDEAAEAEKAAAEAVAARGRAVKAAEEAAVAEEKAQRAARRALEKDLAAKEEALDAARAGGDRTAIAAAESEVRAFAAKLAAMNSRLSGGGSWPVARGQQVLPAKPRPPYRGDEGLPPVVPRPGAETGVADALDWLARHQDPDGFWDADGFASRCAEGKCPGPGGPLFDPGVTGLSALAFLGNGETHQTPKHGPAVRNALKYLKGIQDAEGCFGTRTSNHFTYNHALAAQAMAEAFALTQSPLFRESAQRGTDFILLCQNPYLAWRYGVRPQDNDTAVTGWMVMALRSAKGAGLAVNDAGFTGAVAWLDKVTEPEYGRAGYTARGNGPARPMELMDAFPCDRTESLTAEAVLTRLLCGQGTDNESVRKGLDLCAKVPPSWDAAGGGIDFYYWYFGTLANLKAGGDRWRTWSDGLRDSVASHQRGADSGCARGSWDPVDPWGPDGGRVYSTAINALTLEAYARYGRVEGGK